MIASKIDILIVEDDAVTLMRSEKKAKNVGLTVKSFSSGIEALKYLKGLDPKDIPDAALVDMRLSTDNNNAENLTPPQIFEIYCQHGKTKNFRFYTGTFSAHDGGVKNITKAKILLKGDLVGFSNFITSLND